MAQFDPWRESDEIRALITFAQLEDVHGRVTANDAGQALGIDNEVARRAQHRLRTLGLSRTALCRAEPVTRFRSN